VIGLMVIPGNVVGKLEENGTEWKRALGGSWFEQSNLSIEEVIKFTYWWCQGLQQCQIKQQLGLGSHTAVDWDMFCRELCEVVLFDINLGKYGYEHKTVNHSVEFVNEDDYDTNKIEGQ